MKANAATADSERYLGKPEVCARYDFDPGTILRKVRDGIFPPPSYIFGRARWKLSDVLAWEAANIQAKPAPNARNLRHAKVAP